MHICGFCVLLTLLGIAIGAALLAMFYRVVRTEWPLNYASISGDPGIVVNRTFGKYSLFALAPTYIVALLTSTIVGREGGHAMMCALGIGILHTSRTQVVRIVNTFRQRRSRRSNPAIIYSAITGVGLVVVSCLAGLGLGSAQFVVPPLEEFFKAFWTAALVIVLAAFIARTTTVQRSVSDLVEKSRRELGDALLFLSRQTAADHDADPWLAEAILLTENLQRPGWFRRLEKLKGRLVPAGTYGPMQVWAPHPISDGESIVKAVSERLSGVQVKQGEYGGPDHNSLQKVLRRYNSNRNFVDVASDIYYQIYHEINGEG